MLRGCRGRRKHFGIVRIGCEAELEKDQAARQERALQRDQRHDDPPRWTIVNGVLLYLGDARHDQPPTWLQTCHIR
jgi:hypothetical protein